MLSSQDIESVHKVSNGNDMGQEEHGRNRKRKNRPTDPLTNVLASGKEISTKDVINGILKVTVDTDEECEYIGSPQAKNKEEYVTVEPGANRTAKW